MKNTISKQGFTLLEMTFVIVILGIVAAISSEVIATSYISYINQRALQRASIKTELAAQQIANRLAYAIPGSIVARNGGALIDISHIPAANALNTLQWIGADNDSFTTRGAQGANDAASRLPGWSGFCSRENTQRMPAPDDDSINLNSPGSNFARANTVINNLSAGRTGGARGLAGSALYFKKEGLEIHNDADRYNPTPSNGIYNVVVQVAGIDDRLQITAPAPAQLSDQYKLAWTSYAIVPVDLDGDGEENDLVLRYNFRPWNGERYNSNVAGAYLEHVLIKNISVFRFTGTRNSVRFKICKPEQISSNRAEDISICKEKVVIR